MIKRLLSVPLYLIFIFLNLYWLQNHEYMNIYKQMSVVLVSIVVFILASLIVIVYAKDNRQRKFLLKFLSTLLLGYYSLFIIAVVFLDGFFFSRQETYYVNKVPFYTIRNFYYYMRDNNDLNAFANLVGNAILFAPLGLLLPLFSRLFDKTIIFTVFITALVGGVEFMQYYFHLGGADVDDIILNVLGALIVFAMYKFIAYLAKDKIEIYFKD